MIEKILVNRLQVELDHAEDEVVDIPKSLLLKLIEEVSTAWREAELPWKCREGMTVEDLMEALKKFPLDADVYIKTESEGLIDEAEIVEDLMGNGKIVVIRSGTE